MKSEDRDCRDCYSILGVKRDAGRDAIKQARDKLVNEFHPEMFPEHKEEVRAYAFQRNAEIEVACGVLTDKHKKEEHDRILSEFDAVMERRGRGEVSDSDVNEILEMLEDFVITGLRDYLYKKAKSDQEKAALKTLLSIKDPPIKWDFASFDWTEPALEKKLGELDAVVDDVEL